MHSIVEQTEKKLIVFTVSDNCEYITDYMREQAEAFYDRMVTAVRENSKKKKE